MPVRVDGAETVSAAMRRRSPHRTRGPMIALLAGVVIIVLLLGVLIGVLVSGRQAAQAPAPPPPAAVEALPRSGVVAGGGGLGHIYEMRTGFHKSTEGAVEAVMNYTITDSSAAYYNQRKYEAMQAYMFTGPQVRKVIGFRQSAVDNMRKRNHVNADGQPLTNGKPDPAKKIYDAAYLQYGAYRVITDEPARVRVMLWYPVVWGVDYKNATTTKNMHIDWGYADQTVEWVRGDWRLSSNETTSVAPKSKDPAQIVTSFAQRAHLLGTDKGWTLPANAVQVDTPQLQLPGK